MKSLEILQREDKYKNIKKQIYTTFDIFLEKLYKFCIYIDNFTTWEI